MMIKSADSTDQSIYFWNTQMPVSWALKDAKLKHSHKYKAFYTNKNIHKYFEFQWNFQAGKNSIKGAKKIEQIGCKRLWLQ